MNVRQEVYDFVRGLINLVWIAMPWGLPFILLRLVVGLLRWAHRTARGETFDDMRTDYHTARERFRTHTSTIRRSMRRP